MDRIAVWMPLLVGSGAIAFTIVIHGAALGTNLRFVRYERALGHVGAGYWVDLRIIATTVMLALMAHLTEIGVWAVLLVVIGEFQELGVAFYHSAMNYTSLGYGDIIMSPAWKLLGPFEAINGLLMFGVSTAMIVAVIQRVIEVRFPDIRG
jgi:hypothetical protein